MKSYIHLLFPIFVITIGIISLSGVNIFGSAILEGAAWKQNVILILLIIFGILPPSVRGMRSTWMLIGFAIAFFLFGGANFIGTVGMILNIGKIILGVLALFIGYRLYATTWNINKLFMLAPFCAVVFIGILFTIQDQNIIESGLYALSTWSSSNFTSDKGFHIFLGLAAIAAGISEMLIQTSTCKINNSTMSEEVSNG